MSHRSSISLSEALEAVLDRAPAPVVSEAASSDALGRTLAADLRARADHPNVANSALDGYACRAVDTAQASRSEPVRLRIVGEVPAGRVFEHAVGPGEAVAIYTGGAVPTGADAIVPIEATDRHGDVVSVQQPARREDIRPRAQDLREGAVGLRQGRLLDAVALALAAGMGHAVLPVAAPPRVAILATGSELVPPGGTLKPGQVFDANATGIAALVKAAGAEPLLLPPVADDMDALAAALRSAPRADLILTSGGVSMGAYDLVRDLMFTAGEVDFWKVTMKPGGPTLFGTFEGIPLLGLPGNPVSSLVVFLLLGRAFIERALGRNTPPPYRRRTTVLAGAELTAARGKETFARVKLAFEDGHTYARSTGSQSSGILRSMVEADALAILPANARVQPGEPVDILRLEPLLR